MVITRDNLAPGSSLFGGGGSGTTPHGRLNRAELRWAIAFALPYAAVFLGFIVYPFGYALWMVGDPSLFRDLIADPLYASTLINTLIFVGLAVNLKMFLALLLSGFFLRRRWWVKALLTVYVIPWVLASAQACVSIHWMLIDHWGLVDNLLWTALGVEGPNWFGHRWLGLGADAAAYIWKWMPFWTLIFLAARLIIPRQVYDMAEIDGATGARRFFHITFPLLANLYLICTLLSTLWALGDFTTVYLVSGGGPGGATEVLATLGFHFAFDDYNPALGVATVMSALPLLIPVAVISMRWLQTRVLQL